MLLEFGLKNFFCFKEGISISFKLDSNCPADISMGRDFTTVLGIKGANGSGKTHALKGLVFLSEFCTNSFSHKPEDSIGVMSFFDNEHPSEFNAEFSMNGTTYFYELSLTVAEVKRESVYVKIKNGRKEKVFERIDDKLTTGKTFSKLNTIKLRKNASLISTAHQYELDVLDDVYAFFNRVISNVLYFTGLREIPYDISSVSKFLNENNEILNFIGEFISECDTGITGVRIFAMEEKIEEKKYFPIFEHEFDKKLHPITEHTESSGTKALFRNLPLYYAALQNGGLLVLDEFDNHLHPHILPKLLQLFLDPETNKKNAQIIFSTHDAEILNLLGRYRTYLMNKEGNESFAYRLDEIPGDVLRNDRPILPAYNDGKIGGIPKL